MDKSMGRALVVCVVFFMNGVTGAALFTDDFNRADVGPTTNGSLIGANYVNTNEEKDWQISGNKLVFPEPGYVPGGATLYNTSVQTLTSAEGVSFSIQADVTIDNANRWASLVFNYQGSDNYYSLRVSQDADQPVLKYQFLQVFDGAAAAVVNKKDSDTFTLGHTYNLSVSYDQSTDNYIFLVKDGSTILNNTTNILGSELSAGFDDGYGGVSSGINMSPTFDNLSITSIPEPTTLGLVVGATFALFGIRRLRY